MRFVLACGVVIGALGPFVGCGDNSQESAAGSGGTASTSSATTGAPSGSGGSSSSTGAPGGGGTGGGGTRPLGKATALGTVDCATVPNGGGSLPPGAACQNLAVDCPGAETIHATVAVMEPSSPAKGTIVVHDGGGGTTFFNNSPELVGRYITAGYRAVYIQWASDWEQINSGTASIKVAACRPATVIQWVFDGPHGGTHDKAFCGQGQSGGSGVMAYALANYGMKDYFDYVMLTQGPPFGKMDCGCDPGAAGCTPPPLCPEIQTPALKLPEFVAPWEGISSCGKGLTPAELDKLAADSVAASDGDFDYPKTNVSGWYCAQMPNGTTGGGAFYLAKVTTVGGAKPSVFCSPNCSQESIYLDAAELTDMTLVSDAMFEQMTSECTPRHLP